MEVNRIFLHLQGTKDKGLLFNSSNKLVVGCYADADFLGLWGHGNHHGCICDRSMTVFVVTFPNFPLLQVSKIQSYIALYTLYYEYLSLSDFVR